MKRFMGVVTIFLVTCSVFLGAGDTPIEKLQLVGDANGNGYSFTGLKDVVVDNSLMVGGNSVLTNEADFVSWSNVWQGVVEASVTNEIDPVWSNDKPQYVTFDDLAEQLNLASLSILYGATNAPPFPMAGGSLYAPLPPASWQYDYTLSATGTYLAGTYWYTQKVSRIPAGTWIGRWQAERISGNATVYGYIVPVYSANNGVTTNTLAIGSQTPAITSRAQYESYATSTTTVYSATTSLWLGVQYYIIRVGGNATVVRTYGGAGAGTHLAVPGLLDGQSMPVIEYGQVVWEWALPVTNWGPKMRKAAYISQAWGKTVSGVVTAQVYRQYYTNTWLSGVTLLGSVEIGITGINTTAGWSIGQDELLGVYFSGGQTQQCVFGLTYSY